ncbi:hypothetical protein E4T39_05002 [Aureobasidium subglaciale]|nr:hypothetical protein E4T39_05002 [Aureobasidium subglaciale]
MSQSNREARREARRAESPPNPRERRRRRLNSATDHTRFRTPLSAEQLQLWVVSRSLEQMDQVPSHSSHRRGQTIWMDDQDAGPSSVLHPRNVDFETDDFSILPFADRSIDSRRYGPLLSLNQIVSSQKQPASAPVELPVSSTADHDDSPSDCTESSQDNAPPPPSPQSRWPNSYAADHTSPWDSQTIPRNEAVSQAGAGRESHAGFSPCGVHPLEFTNPYHQTPLAASQTAEDASQISRNVELRRMMEDHGSSAKKSTYPVNPAILLVYQLDRDTPQPTLRFLPFIPESQAHNYKTRSKRYMIQPSHKQQIDASQLIARRAHWIPGEFPVELFELITQHLSRDDIKSMRLVNKEFELGVSHSLFDTVVVPFNTELYEMIEQKVVKRDMKGKRRADDPVNNFVDLDPGSLLWKNALIDTEDKVYRGHGLKVFEGFGGHIRRFGMSFEIKEEALQNPPQKNQLDQHESYFGCYEWPSQEYTRYEQLAGLERTADETSQMKLAFSHLSKVQQLALSMDSGLGWMNGPDKSLRSLILQHPSPLFGCSHGVVDAQQQERLRLWQTIESAHDRLDALEDLKEGYLERSSMEEKFFHRSPFSTTPYASPSVWATAPASAVVSVIPDVLDSIDDTALETGVLYINSYDSRDSSSHSTEGQRTDIMKKIDKFSPANLDNHQREWLLEAEWAQRAFLTTYMLGVVDNSSVFDKVSVLNFRISSHLVPLLARHDFWSALPNLTEITLAVIPDWRTVKRDDAGIVETKDIDPSLAVDKTYDLLQAFIGVRPNITKLNFAWAAGGEHAEGIFARNHHILPAPVIKIARSTAIDLKDEDLVDMPHIKDLTFSNCWFTPISIVMMVEKLRKDTLKKIKFDSVSLTAMPRVNANNQNPVNAFQNPVQPLAPGMIVLGGNAAAQFGAQVWQGPPPGTPVQQWAQTMFQDLNIMLQQQGIAVYHVPQIWTNHPMGLTLQQIHGILAGMSSGNARNDNPMAQPGTLYQLPLQQQQQQGGAAQFQPLPLLAHIVQPPQPAIQALPGPANTPWYDGHRSGSWVKVIDTISPGPRLEMYEPRDECDPEPERRKKELAVAEFKSCGYVQLRAPAFDQNNVEAPVSHRMSRHFSRRQSLLSSAMLSTQDKLVGTIVQHMSEHESDALRNAWGMSMGWDDAKLAEEAEYDGYLAGGTGRFSGSVTKDSPVQEAYTAHHS